MKVEVKVWPPDFLFQISQFPAVLGNLLEIPHRSLRPSFRDTLVTVRDATVTEITLAHYRILQRLGAGGMGEVHLAEDLNLGRRVALKTLPASLQSDDESKRRLLREARAAARLDHPNVATIYEVGEADGQSFIAMQYVEGETLAHRIHRSMPTAGEVRSISRDVLAALAAAHARQLVHRDIKPQNIMIAPDGRAVVLDFGLARLTGATSAESGGADDALTAAGVVCGTLSYMSPEQLRAQTLDGRTDLFSFGVVLYEMISGRRPFDSDSAPATIAAILFGTPPPLIRGSSVFDPIVERALQKDPDARYQSAKEMLDSFGSAEPPVQLTQRLASTEMPAAPDRAQNAQLSRAGSLPGIAPAALELYAKARVQWNKRTPQGIQLAIEHFHAAVELAPSFALVHAGLADCYNYLAFFDSIAASDVMNKVRAAATCAIELDERLAEPHASLGFLEWCMGWDWEASERALVRAIELNPDFALAPHWYSTLLSTEGRVEEAMDQAERAVVLDPLNPIISTALGFPWFFSRRFEDAIHRFRKTEETDSRFPPVYYYLGLAFEQLGEFDEAIATFERGNSLAPEGIFTAALAHCHAVSGEAGRAREVLDGLQTRARRRYVSPFHFALIHAGLGDLDAVFSFLPDAFEQHSPRLATIASDGRFDAVLRDPRFAPIADQYRLPPGMRIPFAAREKGRRD